MKHTVTLAEDLWLWEDDEGTWNISRALVTDRLTGKSRPGATEGKKIVIFAGQTITVEL